MKTTENISYFKKSWLQFLSHRLGAFALVVVILFSLVGIYAPLLASSKPLAVLYDGQWYFPLFRYLFYTGFYTKLIDLFFNIAMFSVPLLLLSILLFHHHSRILKGASLLIIAAHFSLFLYFVFQAPKDPSVDTSSLQKRHEALKSIDFSTWDFELNHMTPYGKLNQILRYRQHLLQHQKIMEYGREEANRSTIPTLWNVQHAHEQQRIENLQEIISKSTDAQSSRNAKNSLDFLQQRRKWLQKENNKIEWIAMPLIRPYHWEDDAGGEQSMNRFLPWWELTRINQKDLLAGLIFGVRISLVVGLLAVSLAMVIGVPIGAFAGYYGGTFDIIVSRLLEIWESMPTFFMLLLVVAMTQSKSIFLVIAVVGIFGWTGFSRYIRGEFFKQRNLPYVEACHALGFRDGHIMFSHILPNAIPPVLTLLPFAIMGAITSEAGLSFLGLGEEGSCSWGVLMDEGRSAFPAESYLLWPPALLLTVLLVAIALVGDALRDTLDPKMHR